MLPTAEAGSRATQLDHDEKRISTSSNRKTEQDKSTASPAASLTAPRVVGEDPEKDEVASNTSKHPATQHQTTEYDEKNVPVVENESPENGGVTSGEATIEGSEDDDIEVIYPKGLALALLTLGLCLSTFTVALDNTIIGKNSSYNVRLELSKANKLRQQRPSPRSQQYSILWTMLDGMDRVIY